MIFFNEGRIGSGKTFGAVRRMLLSMASGSIIATNAEVYVESVLGCAPQPGREGENENYGERNDQYPPGWVTPAKRWAKKEPKVTLFEACYQMYGAEVGRESVVFEPNLQKFWEQWRTIVPIGTRECRNKIFFDEFHRVCNARDWKSTNDQTLGRENLAYASHSRHYHQDIEIITQDALNVDSQFRRLAQGYIRSKNMKEFSIPLIGKPCPFDYTLVMHVDYDGKFVMRREMVYRDPRIFMCYESESREMDKEFQKETRSGRVRIDKSKKTWIELKKSLEYGLALASLVMLVCVFW